jgi:hypothetical protein
MKVIKYTLITLVTFVVTIVSLVYLSPSFRGDIVGLLAWGKNQLTNGSAEDRSRSNGHLSQVNKQQKQKTPQNADNAKSDPVSMDPSQNSADKSALPSSDKALMKVTQTISIGSVESSNAGYREDQGFIYVMSTPESAWVKVDDVSVGRTPVTVRVSPTGIYNVVARLNYFDTWEKGVTVSSSQVTKVHAKLSPGKGTLTVLSVPQEAQVYLDGIEKGKTPLTVKSLAAGMHTLDVVTGNKEYNEQVEILAGENKVIDCTLNVLKVGLNVSSEPSGAKVYIDGVYAGTTPAKINDLQIGVHQIVLERLDALAFADSILVSSEGDNDYVATLVKKTGLKDIFSAKMKIDSEFKKAFAYVDGRFRGLVPVEIENMRSGEHEVLIVKTIPNGSYHYKTKLFVAPYDSKEIKVNAEEFEFEKRL